MSYIAVKGGNRLNGELYVQGAKNAALPLLSAALLTDNDVVIKNCPRILDIYYMRLILERIGCQVDFCGDSVRINASKAHSCTIPGDISGKIRSSVFMMGSVLSRFGCVKCSYPGGCEIGSRPIDLHLSVLEALGADVSESSDGVYSNCTALKGNVIELRYPSVGTTENAVLAAALAQGTTVLNGAAKEPEIVDLANMLTCMGADISGAGTDTIIINGVSSLKGVEYTCMPDRIAAGTYMCAAAATGGNVTLNNIIYSDVAGICDILTSCGVKIIAHTNSINIISDGRLSSFGEVSTAPYPGFPTDMQAQLCAVACTAEGTSKITENIFDNRIGHIAELKKMGADITLDGRTAIIKGRSLYCADMHSRDLRGGAALIIAALTAKGTSKIYEPQIIDRGYCNIESTMNSLGADIQRIEE